MVPDRDGLTGEMVNSFAYGDTALVEQLVVGTEVAVPVVDTGEGPRALPAVEIRPDGGVYDYTARYTAGSTEFLVPAKLSDEAAARTHFGRLHRGRLYRGQLYRGRPCRRYPVEGGGRSRRSFRLGG